MFSRISQGFRLVCKSHFSHSKQQLLQGKFKSTCVCPALHRDHYRKKLHAWPYTSSFVVNDVDHNRNNKVIYPQELYIHLSFFTLPFTYVLCRWIYKHIPALIHLCIPDVFIWETQFVERICRQLQAGRTICTTQDVYRKEVHIYFQ